MAIRTLFRLLGLISPQSTDNQSIRDAKRLCSRHLGLPESVIRDDKDVVKRLLPVLEQRGFSDEQLEVADTHGRSDSVADVSLIAGGIWQEDSLAKVIIEIEPVGLDGNKQGDSLGRTQTTVNGQFLLGVKRSAARLVCAHFKDQQGETLHRTAPRSLAPEMWFEWSVSGELVPQPGRFEIQDARLKAELASSGDDRELSDLRDSPETLVTSLAELTEISADVVRQHVVAAVVAKAHDVPAPAAAAVIGRAPRTGERRVLLDEADVPTLLERYADSQEPRNDREDLQQLIGNAKKRFLTQNPDSLDRLLADAAATREITAISHRKTEEIKEKIRKGADKQRGKPADRKPRETGNTWRELLAEAGVQQEKHVEEIATTLSEGHEADVWKRLDASADSQLPTAKGLRDSLAVAKLAGYDKRVIKPLAGRSPRAVAVLDHKDLDDNLRESVPEQEERNKLIERIQDQADIEHPGDALVRRRYAVLKEETKRFLKRRGEAFDLNQSFVDGELVEEADRDKMRDELLTLQRVTRVARDGRAAALLLENGYDSAQKIAFTNRAAFIEELEPKGIAVDQAAGIHRQARARYRATLETYLRLNRGASGPGMAALPLPADAAALDAAAMSIPTYADLFGSQDYCYCEDWESVTSHSAYLVDLLVWLYRSPTQGGANPYNELKNRRPDLVHILLNEPNTKTQLPHIDLVCELLEDAAAVTLGADRILPDELQTTRTEEEIRAFPEHVNTQVYDHLGVSTAAMSLPFDLPLAEVRRYLQLKQRDKEKITRLALIELFGIDLFQLDEQAKDAAAEILGLNNTEFGVIANLPPHAVTPQEVWGAAEIADVDVFLRKAPSPFRSREHLSYDELLALLETEFIYPPGKIQIKLKDGVDECKAEQRRFDPSLGAQTLDRIHRLLRLAGRTRCSFAELDLLIAGIGQGSLYDIFLVNLAAARRCQDLLAITTEELAALFRDFREADAGIAKRVDGTIPLYRRVYLVRTDAEPIPEAFTKENPDHPSKLYSEEGPSEAGRVSAALGIAKEEYLTLLALAGVEQDDNVTFPNLSRLFRYALVRRAVDRKFSLAPTLADLAILIEVIGDPLENLEALTEFLEALSQVKKAGLSASDLSCVCIADDPVLPESPKLSQAILELRAVTAQELAADGQISDPEDLTPEEKVKVTKEIDNKRSWLLAIDARLSASAQTFSPQLIHAFIDPEDEGHADTIKKLAGLLRLFTSLRVTQTESTRIHQLPAFRALMSVTKWAKLANFLDQVILARELSTIEAFADYVVALRELQGHPTIEEHTTELQKVSGFDQARLAAAWRAIDAADPPGVAIGVASFLTRVHQLAATSATLGVEPATLKTWVLNWPTSQQAAEVRNAVRATMSRSPWLEQSAQVQNELRGEKRNALVDYLLATDPELALPIDFMGRFLIDVEMEACRETSRIVQAASTIQVFVQRCLLGLEPEVLPDAVSAEDDPDWREWEWRKRYRVWEANRKIFLYPENFLSVSNRSDASPLFNDFQKQVAENEITDENVAVALEGYLTGLDKISRLTYEAADTYVYTDAGGNEEENDEGNAVLGVLARSGGSPPSYYYRRFSGTGWTPWEEVSFGPSPTALSLGQGDNRAWVVWPVTTQHMLPDQTIPLAQQQEDKDRLTVDEDGGKGLTYIRYSWTTRDRAGVWSPIKTTSHAVLVKQAVAARDLAVNVGAEWPSPGVFQILLQVPSPDPDNNEVADRVHLAASMNVARDSTMLRVDRTLTGWKVTDEQTLKNQPRWREHWIEYRLSLKTVYNHLPLKPWPGFHFDRNRMVRKTKQDGDYSAELKIPNTATEEDKSDSISLLRLDDPLRNFPLSITKHKDYVDGTTGKQEPSPHAFFVNGDDVIGQSKTSWSVMFLSPSVLKSLLGEDRNELFLTTTNAEGKPVFVDEDDPDKYLMVPAYHPFADELLRIVQAHGIQAIYSATLQEKPFDNLSIDLRLREPFAYGTAFGLNNENVLVLSNGKAISPDGIPPSDPDDPNDHGYPPPKEAFDFEQLAPYSPYNWELFYFAPLFVGLRLNSALRHEDAQAYFHFIFNPLSTEPNDPTEPGDPKARFWVTKPFRQNTKPKDVQSILAEAAASKSNPWSDIEKQPFDPHAVAKTRPAAYQKYVVMRYLDNLVDWGDQLYRRGNREDIDEAIPIYQLAQTILGDRPNQLGLLGRRLDRAFVDPEQWLGGSNLLADLEGVIRDVADRGVDAPLVHLPLLRRDDGGEAAAANSLYFRVPPNEQMLEYWNTVERRLSYIHSCLTIDGAVAALPLAAAPINPQALADAAALGLSVADAIAEASAKPPLYRFRTMLGKAQEYCSEAKALGGALLNLLEKRDSEHLAAVRSKFEEPILNASRSIKLAQQKQAEQEITVLEKAKEVVLDREQFYSDREYMNDFEKATFGLSIAAGALDTAGAVLNLVGGSLQLIPDVEVGVEGFGGTPVATVKYGGSKAASSVAAWANGLSLGSRIADRAASMTATQAGYARREEDWSHQASQASLESKHLDEQIAAARLRQAVIVAEIKGQAAQDASWRQTDRLLREKFTNKELYDWYLKRLTDLFKRCYDQAQELALLARKCFVFETGQDDAPGPDRGAWERARGGLTAGEALGKYLRDLDLRYLEHPLYDRLVNAQHVSLRYAAPSAFLALITSRSTREDFTIPAWWFKRLYPGLERRRIRSLAISIPCVTGPYANVNATLVYKGDNRTVVKALSLTTGNHDFGWDMSTRTEKYVPFEGVSLDHDTLWNLSFPDRDVGDVDFDLASISDVVFHIEYTADEGSDPVNDTDTPPNALFIDVARMVPEAWARLVAVDGSHSCSFDTTAHIPVFLKGYTVTGIREHVLLDGDGNELQGQLEYEVEPATGEEQNPKVAIKQAEGVDVPWSRLRHLYLVLDVEKTA